LYNVLENNWTQPACVEYIPI